MPPFLRPCVALVCGLMPDAFIEAVARAVGYLFRVLIDRGHVAESYVRGMLFAPRVGAARLCMARNVQLQRTRLIAIGERVALHYGCCLVAGRMGGVRIGSRSHIGNGSYLCGLGGIRIGEACAISSSVQIFSVTNQYREQPQKYVIDNPVEYREVVIGDDVWIGSAAVILPGVKIEDHAIVGAGSVVTRDVGFGEIVAGVPARLIGNRLEERSIADCPGGTGQRIA